MSKNSAWSGARPHIDESELLCKMGCGFYGNPTWDGHCSKCYKELVQKQQQRKTVFDPTQIKNKVSQSVSDVSELQSKASSLMSRKFDKFDERRRQELDKKTRAVKSIFMKSQANKGPQEQHKEHKVGRQLSEESQAAVSKFQDFFKTISKEAQQLISKHIKNFMDKSVRTMHLMSVDELGDHVHDFYNNLHDLISKHPVFNDFTQDQIDIVGELTELYITTRLYEALIREVNAFSEEKDLTIQKRIRNLMWVSPSHLECKVDESKEEVRNIMDEIITDLIEIDSKRVPSFKLKLLVSASHQVLNLLSKSSGGVPASADDFLPALIYCVIRANPPLLQSNICYITNFAQQSCLQSGEAGYFFTNLCCAVSFIEKLTADSLGLSQAEFDRYMSGDALPPNALHLSYMSEGMQLMQQTLDNFSELAEDLDRISKSYDTIVEDMEAFKDNLIEEVDRIMGRTPLIIRPKKANIDEPDPTQELLPPPLMPQCLKSEEKNKEERGTSNLFLPFEESNTPTQSLDSNAETPLFSSEIWAAQKSLNFVQKLETPTQDCYSSDIQVDYQSLENLASDSDPFLQDSIAGACGYSHSLDSYSLTDSSPSSLQNRIETQVESNPISPPLNISKTLGHSKSLLPANPPPYTGFSIQGGRIPSIPCDTGFSHCISDPLDSLSPSSDDQISLPTPIIPTSTLYTILNENPDDDESETNKKFNFYKDLGSFDTLQ